MDAVFLWRDSAGWLNSLKFFCIYNSNMFRVLWFWILNLSDLFVDVKALSVSSFSPFHVRRELAISQAVWGRPKALRKANKLRVKIGAEAYQHMRACLCPEKVLWFFASSNSTRSPINIPFRTAVESFLSMDNQVLLDQISCLWALNDLVTNQPCRKLVSFLLLGMQAWNPPSRSDELPCTSLFWITNFKALYA